LLHFIDFFFSSRRRHTRFSRDWSSDVCSSDLTRKVEWEGLLNSQFASNRGIDALDKAITQKSSQLGAPKRKRKVVIGLPEPWPRSEERRVGKESGGRDAGTSARRRGERRRRST